MGEDVEASKNNMLFMKILEDKKEDSRENAKESRIKNINRYLKSTQNYRQLGLLSLYDFLELHTVVSSTFTTERECQELEWLEAMLRMIDNKSEEPEKCFPILSKLVKISSQHPDMHKIIQGKYVSKIIDAIVNNQLSIPALQCLIIVLKEYSGTCGIYKNKIYDYCISSVDILDLTLNNLAGKCMHLLQQTRGGNVGGSAHKKNWAEYHEKLLNTIEELLINLFQTGESVNSGKSERLKLPLEGDAKKNMPQMYRHQERFIRFQNICIYLNMSLIQPFPAAKSILLEWIISFLDKSITLNQAQMNKKVEDRILPFVLHIEIQKCLLDILHSVIKAVERNIMIHSKDVCDIFWRSLKNTNVPYDEFKIKEISSLRCKIYDVIAEFMRLSPNNYFIGRHMENFIKEAFLDITPIQTEILLTLPNSQTSNKNKKKKMNRDTEVKTALSGKTVDNCIKLHQELCVKSLNFLNSLLICNGAGIKPVLFKILTDKILTLSYKFLSRDITQQDLYHSGECRLMILEVIYNILINPAVRNATPSSFMVELLKKFKDNDTNENLRHKAYEMIRTVEAILHNRKDPIHFAPDLKDFRDSWLFNEKTVKSFTEINSEKSCPITQTLDVNSSQEQIVHITEDDEDIEGDDNAKQIASAGNSVSNGISAPIPIKVDELKAARKLSTKRKSESINEKEVPVKIVKQVATEDSKNIKTDDPEDDDILNSYMADFCDE